MFSKLLIFFIGFIVLTIEVNSAESWKPVYIQPEQLHISLGEQPTEIVATWTTMEKTSDSICHYGEESKQSFDYSSRGYQQKFIDGGPKKRHMYIHRVYMKNLQPDTRYIYHCGSENGWSELFFFKTFPKGNEWQPRFVIYGDLGNDNAQTMSMLQEEIQLGHHDLVTHVGDFAYDMHTDNALVGDEFMRQIQPIAAYVPYQVMAGNHERDYNYSNYNHRFTMHSQGEKEINNHFWSYNIGPVHLIAINTDFWEHIQYGTHMIENQFKWLEQDLKRANEPENRKKQPWIITMGHHPLYYQATRPDNKIRIGNEQLPGLEPLLYKYGVDLSFWAHDHIYTRFLPVYNEKIFNGTRQDPYFNPKSPVHIITGSAGCREFVTPVHSNPNPYTAYVSNDYGYTYMTVLNETHIQLRQISRNQMGKIIDEFMLVKEKHGPEAWLY
ncbi:Acid phosphatase type 7 [Dermatophagoides pteronyssinus]|uniref:Purple acid phosphatase n=1 Tax=Dermatophagoides pteronyssinus TaxID=6956 RepID=A0ABQ8J8M9_DERPT|nr:Acid phosphatase type 7 [Dermatophagoides pteronyssinus]